MRLSWCVGDVGMVQGKSGNKDASPEVTVARVSLWGQVGCRRWRGIDESVVFWRQRQEGWVMGAPRGRLTAPGSSSLSTSVWGKMWTLKFEVSVKSPCRMSHSQLGMCMGTEV